MIGLYLKKKKFIKIFNLAYESTIFATSNYPSVRHTKYDIP